MKPARRALLTMSAALALTASLPAVAGAVVVGMGDQTAAMFGDPAFQALHIRQARLTVAWNVATAPSERRALADARTWIADAQALGISSLISFSHNRNYVPTVRQYTVAVKAFLRDFPSVKQYTAWDEPDWVYVRLSRHPKQAANFYNALVRACRRCTVAAGDVYLPAQQLKPWLKSYVKFLRFKPKAWALHNYYDIRTHTTKQLNVMLKLTRGPIWLDEISGVESRGRWQFRNQSAVAAARDEKFLFSLPRRVHRIARIYHYQWQSTPQAGWDSGLRAPNGDLRPAYGIVKAAAGG